MKAIVKFNGGNLALLCSKCHKIIKVGSQFTKEERKAYMNNTLEPQYCKQCKDA